MMHERRQADNVKWKFSLAKQLTPVPDHYGKQLPVLICSVSIGLALIPNRAADRKRRYWLKHPLIKHRWDNRPVLKSHRHWVRRGGIDAQCAFPFAGQRNDSVPQHQAQTI